MIPSRPEWKIPPNSRSSPLIGSRNWRGRTSGNASLGRAHQGRSRYDRAEQSDQSAQGTGWGLPVDGGHRQAPRFVDPGLDVYHYLRERLGYAAIENWRWGGSLDEKAGTEVTRGAGMGAPAN